MLVTVAKRHIEEGKCKIAQKCMIAAAIKDADPNISYVAVRTNGITVTKRKRSGDNVREHFAVPFKAARAIIKFDQGGDIKPFSFEAKLIDKTVITPATREQSRNYTAKTAERRAKLAAKGIPEPKYGRRSRIAGV